MPAARKLANATSEKTDPSKKDAPAMPAADLPAKLQAFDPALTVGILATRWLRTYATPCHSRGATL